MYKEVFNQEFSIDKIPDLPGERWKLIPGYGGRYKASSEGRIKSLCGVYTKILKPCDNGHGYLFVELEGKKIYIHRLVCLAFLGEPEEGKNTVHHKSEIKG